MCSSKLKKLSTASLKPVRHSHNDVPARHLTWKTSYPKTKFQGALTDCVCAYKARTQVAEVRE